MEGLISLFLDFDWGFMLCGILVGKDYMLGIWEKFFVCVGCCEGFEFYKYDGIGVVFGELF